MEPPPPPYPDYGSSADIYSNTPSQSSSFYGDFSGQINIFQGAGYPGYGPPPCSCPSCTGYSNCSCYPYDQYAPRYVPPPDKSAKAEGKPTGEANTKAPNIPPWALYLYPKSHLIVMTPNDGSKLWELNSSFPFSTYQVPTNFSIKELIEQLGGGKDHTITEVHERGDGNWQKGMSIAHGSDKAKERLDSGKVGWTEAKGTDEDPLWVVLHK